MRAKIAGAAALAIAMAGCAGTAENSNPAQDDVSSLEARLSLPAPSQDSIKTLHWQVSGNGVTQEADLDVSSSAELIFQVGNLPVAKGYQLALTGKTVGNVQCGSSAPFDIVDNKVSTVAMTLVCGSDVVVDTDDKGDIRVSVNVRSGDGAGCSVVTGVSALPASVAVGGSLDLTGYHSATAPSTETWSSDTDGTFSAASAAATKYTCVTEGTKKVSYTVSTAAGANGHCDDSVQMVEIHCTAPVTPEICDNGADDDGDGLVDCADPQCASLAACHETACTDGVDNDNDGKADCADSDCSALAICTPVDACTSCVATKCATYYDSPMASLCFNTDNADPTFSQLCTDAFQCSRQAGACFSDVAGPVHCACGAEDASTCQTNGPGADAPCAAQWYAATRCADKADGSKDWSCMTGLMSDTSTPAGIATYTMECANSDACKSVCPGT